MAVPNIFGTATAAIPLSQLDQNFATAITLGNTAVYLGNTTTSLGNVTLTNVTISSGNVTLTGANISGTANVSTLIVTGNQTSLGNVTITGNVSANIATVSAGSNATPAITTTGDTNTGIFFPAADTIAFTEGGAESMRIDSSGNLGLGTTNPSVASGLGIVVNGGAGQSRIALKNTNTGDASGDGFQLAVDTSSNAYIDQRENAALIFNTNNAERARIDSSGNLGIGVTPSAWGNTFNALQINYSAIWGNPANTTIRFSTNTYNNGTNFIYLTSNFATYYAQDSGTHVWYNAPSGTAATTATFTQAMTLDASGNLGIGVTPSAWLAGSQAIQNSSGSFWQFNNTSIYIGQNYYTNSSSQRIYSTTAAATEYQQTAGAHIWFNAVSGTAGNVITFTQAMSLGATGNLAIGTTTVAAGYSGGNGSLTLQNAKSLALNNASNTWSTTTTGGAITYFTDNNLYIDAKDSASNVVFRVNGVTERIRIDSAGNAQLSTGAVMSYAPAPAAISAAATLTNANIQGQIISATGTTYTITMPLGTTLETLAPWGTTNIAYDFYVVNTASGTVTMAVNTGVTSLGTLTIATGVSAQFRIRRTAANTFVLYRLG